MGFDRNELKAARIRRGINQKKMAQLLGYPVPSYCLKENGRRKLLLNDVINIAQVLQLSPQELQTIFF